MFWALDLLGLAGSWLTDFTSLLAVHAMDEDLESGAVWLRCWKRTRGAAWCIEVGINLLGQAKLKKKNILNQHMYIYIYLKDVSPNSGTASAHPPKHVLQAPQTLNQLADRTKTQMSDFQIVCFASEV